MKIPFTKMHGLGNDYVYIDCFATPVDTLPDPHALAARLSNRRFSVGADGLVLSCHPTWPPPACACSTPTEARGSCAATPSAA